MRAHEADCNAKVALLEGLLTRANENAKKSANRAMKRFMNSALFNAFEAWRQETCGQAEMRLLREETHTLQMTMREEDVARARASADEYKAHVRRLEAELSNLRKMISERDAKQNNAATVWHFSPLRQHGGMIPAFLRCLLNI
eukprot:gene10111-11967_t